MDLGNFSKAWWGPPKKFKTEQKDRRVSWLELFYDLVYVIAVSKITHHFSLDITLHGFMEYSCLFALIYWGWLNGSLHHDLHGNQGLRTRLMTLWQMMIIAALAIVLDRPDDHHRNITIVLMVMQAFIAYLWWSVGFYDRGHRRYSWPYTSLYLVSLALMGLSLFIAGWWLRLLLPAVLLCSYAPPFISHVLLRRDAQRLDLSGSMFERLGLFTIIIFGELVLGVIRGITEIKVLDVWSWLSFALGVGLVFGLWWVFFTMIARREAKKNFARASLLELLYIPALIALGFLAAGFPSFFHLADSGDVQRLFGYGIAIFLACIGLMIGLLEFPGEFDGIIWPMRISIFLTAIGFFIVSLIRLPMSALGYLTSAVVLLNLDIVYLNFVYYRQLYRKGMKPADDQA